MQGIFELLLSAGLTASIDTARRSQHSRNAPQCQPEVVFSADVDRFSCSGLAVRISRNLAAWRNSEEVWCLTLPKFAQLPLKLHVNEGMMHRARSDFGFDQNVVA